MRNWINRTLFEEAGDGGDGGGGTATATATAAQPPANPGPTALNSKSDPGGAPESLHDMLPDDLKTSPTLRDIKTVSDLAKSFVHAQQLVGKNRMAAPDDSWSDKDWSNLYNQLGRPNDPSEYPDSDVELPEDAPVEAIQKVEQRLKAAAHKSGLNTKQAKALLDEIRGVLKEGHEDNLKSFQMADQQRLQKLEKTYGEDLSIVLDTARQVLDRYADDEFSQYLEDSRLGNDVRMVQFLNKVAAATSEDKGRSGQGGSGFRTGSPAQARTELNQLMSDQKFTEALYDAQNPQHEWAVQKRMSLIKQSSES